MDPAERWKQHPGALLATVAVGLVIVNVTAYAIATVRWGAIAAYALVLLVMAKLGALDR